MAAGCWTDPAAPRCPCLGHGHKRIIEAICRQAGALAFAHTGFVSSEPAEQLAEVLVGHKPGGLAWAYFVSGGSEAMEAALKLARQYWLERGEPGRCRFIARRQSYHGNTLGALAVGGNAWPGALNIEPLLDRTHHIDPCLRLSAFTYRNRRDDETDGGYVDRLASRAAQALEDKIGSNLAPIA